MAHSSKPVQAGARLVSQPPMPGAEPWSVMGRGCAFELRESGQKGTPKNSKDRPIAALPFLRFFEFREPIIFSGYSQQRLPFMDVVNLSGVQAAFLRILR